MFIFFEIKNSKPQPYNFSEGEFEKYKSICLAIWGALPLEVSWAINSLIYKTAEKKYENN